MRGPLANLAAAAGYTDQAHMTGGISVAGHRSTDRRAGPSHEHALEPATVKHPAVRGQESGRGIEVRLIDRGHLTGACQPGLEEIGYRGLLTHLQLGFLTPGSGGR